MACFQALTTLFANVMKSRCLSNKITERFRHLLTMGGKEWFIYSLIKVRKQTHSNTNRIQRVGWDYSHSQRGRLPTLPALLTYLSVWPVACGLLSVITDTLLKSWNPPPPPVQFCFRKTTSLNNAKDTACKYNREDRSLKNNVGGVMIN